MVFRNYLVIAAVIAAPLPGLVSGCSAPMDPWTIPYAASAKPGRAIATTGTSSAGPTGSIPSGSASTATTSPAFVGAPPYTPGQVGQSTVRAEHAAQAPLGGKQDPAGANCMDCHGPAGVATTKFGAGGTVYTDIAAAPIAGPGIEVRILNAGTGTSAYTDAAGNFYFPVGTQITATSVVGVRNATINKSMGTPPQAGCSMTQGGCHGGGQNNVFLK